MSASEYWDGDPILAIDYRKAGKIRMDNTNTKLWLQGMYIYEALCKVSPVMVAFPEKGAKILEYSKEPYPLDSVEKDRQAEREAKERELKGKAYMENYMEKFNKTFKEKES